MKKYYSIEEAAEHLGVSYTTVYNRIKTGEIKAEKKDFGRIEKYLIPAREIEFNGEVEVMRKLDKQIENLNTEIKEIEENIEVEKENILKNKNELEKLGEEYVNLKRSLGRNDKETDKNNLQKIKDNKSYREKLQDEIKNSERIIANLKNDSAEVKKSLEEINNEKIKEQLKAKARKRYQLDEEIEDHVNGIRECVLKLRKINLDMRDLGKKIGIKFPRRQFTSMIEDYMGDVLSKVKKCPLGKFGRIVRRGKLTKNDTMANYGRDN